MKVLGLILFGLTGKKVIFYFILRVNCNYFKSKLFFYFASEMKMNEDDTKLQFSFPVASAAPKSQYKFAGGYVFGGEDAEITDFPFMASLQIFDAHNCGAALLDSTHILTAAHCVSGFNP